MNRLFKRKMATLLLVSAWVAAFATLGDDGGKHAHRTTSSVIGYTARNFSLRSNYNYRSNQLFVQPERKEFIMLNPVVTYQKGNTAYVLPLKKMPLMGKITFAPQRN